MRVALTERPGTTKGGFRVRQTTQRGTTGEQTRKRGEMLEITPMGSDTGDERHVDRQQDRVLSPPRAGREAIILPSRVQLPL